MAEDTSSAQDQQPGSDTSAPEASSETTIPKKRLDEVIAQREAEKARAATLEAQLAQAIQQASQATETLARFASQPRQPIEPAEPEIDIDPEEAKKFAYIANKVFGPALKELSGIKQAIQETQVMVAGSEGRSKVSRLGVPEPVMAEANKIFNSMQAKGISAFSMEDAVRHVLGDAALQKMAKEAAAPRRMNGTHTIPFVSGVPGINGGLPLGADGQPAVPDLPKNFESLTPKEQMKLLKKRGVLDKAI